MWGAIKKAINSNLNKALDVLIAEKHTETNNKIDSVDSKVQTGNNLIGSTNNTGGTASAGSIFAKLNKLLTDWSTARAGYLDTSISTRATQDSVNNLDTKVQALVNGRVVKSVQFGTFTADKIRTIIINHMGVDVSKSFVIVNGGAPNISGDWSPTYILSRQTDKFVLATHSDYVFSVKNPVSWQVIEFY